MKYKAAIFDLDGTILNTLNDLANSLNFALKNNGFPSRTILEVRSFVGNGVRRLVELGVPANCNESDIEKVLNDFMLYYEEHSLDTTTPYEGILELLNNLKNQGCKIAVVSNKVDYAVQELCHQYFKDLFECAIGERIGVQKKPSPDSVNETLKILGLNSNEAIYIGDSEVDIETAINAKMDSIIVTWGFRDRDYLIENGAKLIVTSPTEIEDIVLGINQNDK